MADVSLRHVSKHYGAVVALDDLSLDIEAGEFVSLLGPSGSGKSTTLNILAGLQDPDTGTIAIGGRDVTHLPPDKRDLALVFQNYALYPHLTVFENIAFPLEARSPRPPRNEIARRVESTASLLGIGDLLARYPKEISGGQQQRVALGRGMVRDPKVFLLDEPLSNLDARLRIRMRRDLRDLHAKLRSTIVYVTHDQSEAMTLSTRIAVFNKGQLQQYASPDEIYNRPANTFVANFVGDRETNFLEAELEGEGERQSVRHPGLTLRPGRSLRPAGARVTIGIRPEAIRPTERDGPNTTPAEVTEWELVGPDLYLFARLVDGTELSCRADPNIRYARGERVLLGFDEARLHFFDAETGASIAHEGSYSSVPPFQQARQMRG